MSNENSGKARHTPGPWVYNETVPRMVIAPKSGYVTRDICRMDGSTTACFEQEANARLIAAAPDLLAALEAVSGRWDGCPIDQCPREVKDARAAIAKARGE